MACNKVVPRGSSVRYCTSIGTLSVEDNSVWSRTATLVYLVTTQHWILLVRSRDREIKSFVVVVGVRIVPLLSPILIELITLGHCRIEV